MGKEDWYRNTNWNDAIADEYFAKLKRTRSKDQYLRIQACYLTKSHPIVALELLDQFFILNEPSDFAQAYCEKAEAYLSLGNINEAIIAYERAIKHESTTNGVQTEAFIKLPMLFAEYNLHEYFLQGIKLLENNTKRLYFPVDHFRWHAAMAIFKKGLGNTEESSKQALLALEAAKIKKSEFRYHRNLGLVGEKYLNIVIKLEEIVA